MEQILLEIPLAWQLTKRKENEMIDFILKRAFYVSETLPARLLEISSNFNFSY
jgi:hypothetical protein